MMKDAAFPMPCLFSKAFRKAMKGNGDSGLMPAGGEIRIMSLIHHNDSFPEV
jgi:hypothetical protein